MHCNVLINCDNMTPSAFNGIEKLDFNDTVVLFWSKTAPDLSALNTATNAAVRFVNVDYRDDNSVAMQIALCAITCLHDDIAYFAQKIGCVSSYAHYPDSDKIIIIDDCDKYLSVIDFWLSTLHTVMLKQSALLPTPIVCGSIKDALSHIMLIRENNLRHHSDYEYTDEDFDEAFPPEPDEPPDDPDDPDDFD